VQHWMSFVDWQSMSVAMILWLALIALVGYAAVLVAWQRPRSGRR
jgi:hypothetical protein